MLQTILLVLMIIVCVAMVAVILLQRSEGGALGMGGGGSGGFMTARGAGNLLTRSTAILATCFFGLAVGLTILGNMERSATLANKLGSTLHAAPQAAPTQAQLAARTAAAEKQQQQQQGPSNSLGGLETGGPLTLTPSGGAGIPGIAPAAKAPAPATKGPAPKAAKK